MFDWVDDGLTPYLIEQYNIEVSSFDDDSSRELVYHQILGEMKDMDAALNGAIITIADERSSNRTHFSEMLRPDFLINQESGTSVLEKIATAVLMVRILDYLRAMSNSSPI
ncbi:MAG TPA: hypothetical protein VLE47_03305 [Candidatus Saccharimonadales bacterium]|nr:hypothetical protein [Candidatus Saccharimonadales bacterium]